MSFAAFVAHERPDGTYDLYHSHNGAEDYMLKPILEQYLAGNVPKDAGAAPAVLPKEVGEVAATAREQGMIDFEVGTPDLIESDPIAEAVPEEEIGNHINFYRHEVGYIVRDWKVEVLIPILASPIILNTLRLRLTADIYRRDEANMANSIEHALHGEPNWSLDESDFTPEGVEQLDEEVYQLLRDKHTYFLDNYQTLLGRGQEHSTGAFLTEDFIVRINAREFDPLRISAGFFIKVPWETDDRPKYPWNDHSTGNHPAIVASQVRFDTAIDFDDDFFEFLDEHEMENLQKGLTQTQLKMMMKLYAKYGDDVTEEFVPKPYAKLIEQAKEAIDSRD